MKNFLGDKMKKIDSKHDPTNLTFDTYDYTECFKKEHEESPDIPPMSPLEVDEEKVKEGAGNKILTLNKLLTRLTVLSAQI